MVVVDSKHKWLVLIWWCKTKFGYFNLNIGKVKVVSILLLTQLYDICITSQLHSFAFLDTWLRCLIIAALFWLATSTTVLSCTDSAPSLNLVYYCILYNFALIFLAISSAIELTQYCLICCNQCLFLPSHHCYFCNMFSSRLLSF